ncbi:MAG: carbamate kinase [Candidatus Aenigmarchaeota archaeon]|nr:carbamate kinase [Candidatus Aenigmarchaeota archaeon]
MEQLEGSRQRKKEGAKRRLHTRNRPQSLVIIALGGNSLLSAKKRFSFHQEMENVHSACLQIKNISQLGYRIVLTHGNGPQVGDILLQQKLARRLVPPMPLDVCGAQTQGELGYVIQRALRPLVHKPIITVLTQTVVDRKDPAFRNPTKFIGPFFSRKEPGMKKDSNRGYRKVVPSPEPLEIVESKEIQRLVQEDFIVIACGGGGIPVFKTAKGYEGAEAVIDKDLASERLAASLGAHILLILTDVECAYLDYGTPKQKPLRKLSLKEAEMLYKQGQFPPGSMGPKILASIRFLKHGGTRAVITSPEKAVLAIKGNAGTEITK